jgi:nucleotide-binding universal stress UspA family protein
VEVVGVADAGLLPTLAVSDAAAGLRPPSGDGLPALVGPTLAGPPGVAVPWRGPSVRYAADPARAIGAHAAEIGAALVVMGTHGRRGFDRFVLGSVAELVLRRAPCPVLVVPCVEGADPAALDGGRIVVPDDLTDAASRAITEAARLARPLGAELEVVHVVEDAYVPSPYGALAAPRADYAALVPRVEAALEARAAGAGVPVRPAVRHGEAAAEIAACAREGGAALIVMASHGRQGLDRVLMGSVAEAVVRRAPCPVLVVRPAARPARPDRARAGEARA